MGGGGGTQLPRWAAGRPGGSQKPFGPCWTEGSLSLEPLSSRHAQVTGAPGPHLVASPTVQGFRGTDWRGCPARLLSLVCPSAAQGTRWDLPQVLGTCVCVCVQAGAASTCPFGLRGGGCWAPAVSSLIAHTGQVSAEHTCLHLSGHLRAPHPELENASAPHCGQTRA